MRLLLCLLGCAVAASAQSQELGLVLGSLRSPQAPAVTAGGRVYQNTSDRVNSGFEANWAIRLRDRLYLEVPFTAAPSGQASGPNGGGYASLFITPGLRVLLTPERRLTPFAFAGGGYAQFERYAIQGVTQDSREHRGAFDFGGGVDFRVSGWLKLRGEVRDYVVASQHHTLIGGGFVLRVRK